MKYIAFRAYFEASDIYYENTGTLLAAYIAMPHCGFTRISN